LECRAGVVNPVAVVPDVVQMVVYNNRKSDDFWSLGLTQIAEIKKNNKVSDKEYEVKAKVLLNNINKLRNK